VPFSKFDTVFLPNPAFLANSVALIPWLILSTTILLISKSVVVIIFLHLLSFPICPHHYHISHFGYCQQHFSQIGNIDDIMIPEVKSMMLGERLRALRHEKKHSLRVLSEKIGIPYSTLGKYERSEREPDYVTL